MLHIFSPAQIYFSVNIQEWSQLLGFVLPLHLFQHKPVMKKCGDFLFCFSDRIQVGVLFPLSFQEACGGRTSERCRTPRSFHTWSPEPLRQARTPCCSPACRTSASAPAPWSSGPTAYTHTHTHTLKISIHSTSSYFINIQSNISVR